MRTKMVERWVVYLMPVKKCPDGMRAVCEQGEWEAMELARPGVCTLIRSGITNEGEAERLARGASGATLPRNSKLRLTSWPGEVTVRLAVAKGQLAG